MDTLLYKNTRILLMATAVIQLAISQIHIQMITRMFTREIGFYLFLFIIGGLLIVFNLTSMGSKASGRLGMFLATTILAVGSGIIFLMKAWADYKLNESVTLADVQTPLIVIAITLVIYVVGGFIISVKCYNEK